MSTNNLLKYAQILEVPYPRKNTHFSSISIDTRTLKEGQLFIAILGKRYNGHHFIEIAHQKKAAAVISQQPVTTNIPYLKVPDTRIALGRLAKYHRQQFSLPIVALTGSCGKTTTKEYLHSIFSQSGKTLASLKSFNNDIGVPLTLLKLNHHHRFSVIEIGANAIGEIGSLTKITQPTIALILNIAPVHLEGFGSIEKVAQAKFEIFKGLPETGQAILPINFKEKWSKYLPTQKIVYFGYTTQADVYAKNIQFKNTGQAVFRLVTKIGETNISLPLYGKHQIDNALAAATATLTAGASLAQIKAGLEAVQSVPGRLNIKVHQRYGRIINDTYNANPKSIRAALELLKNYSQPRIFVLGDMNEMGQQSDYYHTLVGKWARALGIQKLLTYGVASKKAAQSFGKESQYFESQKDLIQALKGQLHLDCTTLIKGSRAMQMENVVEALLEDNSPKSST